MSEKRTMPTGPPVPVRRDLTLSLRNYRVSASIAAAWRDGADRFRFVTTRDGQPDMGEEILVTDEDGWEARGLVTEIEMMDASGDFRVTMNPSIIVRDEGV